MGWWRIIDLLALVVVVVDLLTRLEQLFVENLEGYRMSKTGGRRDQKYGRDDRDRTGDRDGFRSSIPRPDVSSLRKQISLIDKEIVNYNNEMSEIRRKQDKIRTEGSSGRQEFESAKKVMSQLIDIKKALHVDKNSIEASRDASQKKILAGQEKEKAAKAAIKFSSVEAIEKQVKELEKRQARTSMTLTEEKNLMKEIKALNLSKKNFAALEELRMVTDKERNVKSVFDKKYSEKNGEIKEIYKKIDAQKLILDSLNKASSETNKQWPELKKRMEELRALVDAENTKIKDLKAKIKEIDDAHVAAVAEEKKKYKEALAELKKKEEEEELARHPYEEEMGICDLLINYLSTKHLADMKSGPSSQENASSTTPDMSAFSGMKSLKRNDDEAFMGGVVKKKGKKKGGKNNKEGMTHTHESLEHFSSVNVSPPAKLSNVPETIKELEEKKVYYDELERGAIPNLKSIRAKLNNAKSSSDKERSGKTSKKTVFNLESQSEYPEL